MTILITGGTKGIGLAIARRLATPGESLMLGYHSDEAAAGAAVALIERRGARTVAIQADVGHVIHANGGAFLG